MLHVRSDLSIRYGALWNGCSASLAGSGILQIKHGKIFAVHAENSTRPDLDLTDLTVMPALIDCHLHLTLPDSEKGHLAERVNNILAAGIATVREAGSKNPVDFFFPPLHVVSTGQGISRVNHYGSNLGLSVHTVAEAEKMIDRLASNGVAQIKVIASGIFSFTEYGRIGPAPFDKNELMALVRRARLHGLPVMAHASGDEEIRRCLEAGVHSIEHGYFVSKTTLQLMAQSEIFWVPTLAPVAAWLETETQTPPLDHKQRDVVRRSLTTQMEMVALGASEGVKIAAGTDAGAPGVPHGPSLLRELELLRECGLPAVDVLRSATAVAASVCGIASVRGEIAPGKEGCLLAVCGNPLEDLSVLRNIRQIIVPEFSGR